MTRKIINVAVNGVTGRMGYSGIPRSMSISTPQVTSAREPLLDPELAVTRTRKYLQAST
jgi:hypothetical protein